MNFKKLIGIWQIKEKEKHHFFFSLDLYGIV